MPRPKTPYYPTLPPPRLKPDSLLRKYFFSAFSGKHGMLRLVLLTVGACAAVDVAILTDAYLLRPQLYPRHDKKYQRPEKQATWGEWFEATKDLLLDDGPEHGQGGKNMGAPINNISKSF